MRSTLTVLTCLVALVLASVVVASPAQAGGLQRVEPFTAPVVLGGSTAIAGSAFDFTRLTTAPGFRRQRPAASLAPALPSSCGLGLRLGLRF